MGVSNKKVLNKKLQSICENDHKKIKFLNKETNEFWTVCLSAHIYGKVTAGICVSIKDLKNNTIIEKFYKKIHGKDPVDLIDEDNLLLVRAYRDVSTKYGNFCLEIEESSKNDMTRTYSLYHGTASQVLKLEDNDFDFSKYCLYRWQYNKDLKGKNFNRWNMGFVRKDYDGPSLNVFEFDKSIKVDRLVDSPIYGISKRTSNDNGVILLDGELKVKNNLNNGVPDFFDINYSIIRDYEIKDYTSKAYFANPGAFIALLKIDRFMRVEYRRKDKATGKMKIEEIFSLYSSTKGKFTRKDFKKLLSLIYILNIDDRIKDFAIKGIEGYLDVHTQNMDIDPMFSLRDTSFDSLLLEMNGDEVSQSIKRKLELLSETFGVEEREMFGENPFAEALQGPSRMAFLPKKDES